jgi:hypothetical protein
MSLHFFCYRCYCSPQLALPAGGREETMLFYGTNLEPRKLPENAQTPTSRVHAVLGAVLIWNN